MPSSLGPAEILVILVVALIVLGPKRLPEAGRQIGKAMAEVRRWSSTVQSEIRDVIDLDPDRPSSPAPAASPASPPPAPPPPASPVPEWPTPAAPMPPAAGVPSPNGTSTNGTSTNGTTTEPTSTNLTLQGGPPDIATPATPEPPADEASPGGHPAA